MKEGKRDDGEVTRELQMAAEEFADVAERVERIIDAADGEMADIVLAEAEGIYDSARRLYYAATDLQRESTRLRAANKALRAKLAELYPFVGSSCPDECRWRAICDGAPMACRAYPEYARELRRLGVEVECEAEQA